jgi:hypothetical protein
MATKKPAKKKRAVGECPNPDNEGQPYSLKELLERLKEKAFAEFFFELLKKAERNERGAIDCVNSYLLPTVQELQDLGIPAARIESMRRCTESGLLVLVTAQQSAERNTLRR